MQNMVKRLTLSLAVAITGTGIAYAAPNLIQFAESTTGLSLFGVGLFVATLIGSLFGTATSTTTVAAPIKQDDIKRPRKQTTIVDGDRKTVFVGNLAFRASPRQLRELFEPHGVVYTVRIATDRNTRKPRGFGFVEMSVSGAEQAIKALNGHELCNRELTLSEAKQRAPQS